MECGPGKKQALKKASFSARPFWSSVQFGQQKATLTPVFTFKATTASSHELEGRLLLHKHQDIDGQRRAGKQHWAERVDRDQNQTPSEQPQEPSRPEPSCQSSSFKKDWKRQRQKLIWPRNLQHQTSLPCISGQECIHSTGRDSSYSRPLWPTPPRCFSLFLPMPSPAEETVRPVHSPIEDQKDEN